MFSIQDDRISHMLPAFYQDMIVRVYSKKPELVVENKDIDFAISFIWLGPLGYFFMTMNYTQMLHTGGSSV